MSAWRGLANPEQHEVEDGDDFTGCSGCFEECSADWPCRCCIAAEVERLTGVVQQVRSMVRGAIQLQDDGWGSQVLDPADVLYALGDSSQVDPGATLELERAVREALRGES